MNPFAAPASVLLRGCLVALAVTPGPALAAGHRVRCFLLPQPFDQVVTEMGHPENERAMYAALRVGVLQRHVVPRQLLPRLDVSRRATILLSLPRRDVMLRSTETVRLGEDRFVIRGVSDPGCGKVRYFRFEIEVRRAGDRAWVITRLDLSLGGFGKRLVQRWGPRIVLKDLEQTIRGFTGRPRRAAGQRRERRAGDTNRLRESTP